MFKLQALFSLNKLSRGNNNHRNIMPTTKLATSPTTITTSSAAAAAKAVNVSLLLLISMAYLICPIIAWMPDVRPDLQYSKYMCFTLLTSVEIHFLISFFFTYF